MAAIDIPWIPSAQTFLQAIIAGQNANLEKQKLSQHGSGGGGGNPLAAAQAEKIKADTARENAMQDALGKAWELHNSLASRGATDKEAFEQSGLGEFGIKPPEHESPFSIFNGPRGEITAVDRNTLKPTIIAPPGPIKTGAQKYYNVPIAPNEIPFQPPTTVPMTLEQLRSGINSLPEFGRTNAITQQLLKIGDQNSPQGSGAAPSEVVRFTKDGKKAVFDANTKQFLRYAE